ncbi:hypothetical protein O3G_MSEX014253 [Manduca sexta]|uniref:Uncharacterized protein n=2 Tax=Manduca sexta TaxID=7130 RepID=A0A922CZ44_MANSE|nr:hypothetical protein O3G_MSEX014253 [Manduca sexta]
MLSWEPPQCQDPDFKARTFDQEVAYLRLKDALLSAIALCIELADNRPIDEKRPQYEELETCVDAFSTAIEKCREKYCEREKIYISAPFPSRIIAFVNSPVPYRELYSTTLRMVGELAMGRAAAAHALCEQQRGLMARAQDAFTDELRACSGDAGWTMRDKLEALSNYFEFTGIITFILGVCNELITPPNTKKSKKKISQSPDEIKTLELLNKLNETVQSTITFIENLLDDWPNYEYSSTIEDVFAKLNLEDKYYNPVENRLKGGREDVLNDLRNILKKKSKYLKSLVQ